jgi:amidohydrolase
MTSLTARLRELIALETPHATALRRDLHTHPEICYEELRTCARLRDELAKAGITRSDGLAGGTGTIAFLPGKAARAVGLRADIDGLPIHEANDCAWKSTTSGRMHACGHDGHSAILVGAARVLKRLSDEQTLPNPVRFLFQPAEEGGAGGRRMVEDGALDAQPQGPAVRRIFGLHNFPGLALGALSTRRGALFASSDRFDIHVEGQAAHAAWPHHGRDPILAASAIVMALQQLVSRELDPLDAGVVSVTMLHGGSATNQIGSSARLQGTVRALLETSRLHLESRLIDVARNVARAYRCEATTHYHAGYPVTRNDDASVAEFERITREHLPSQHFIHMDAAVMGGEDFAYYAEKIPACFYLLGVEDGAWKSAHLHQPTFDFNDAAIPHGIEAMCMLALADRSE